MMTPLWQFRVGAILAALAVAFGAFGAHAMREHLTPARMDTWKLASQYLLVHAVALVALGASGRLEGGLAAAGTMLLTVGCVVFSGSLYVLCLTNQGFWGAITPLGGLSFIVGWLIVAFSWSGVAR
jgi:uncharacterized membrane protein YgdD (TMEM256/DUF423 family)